ncbi:MAG: DUF58 domain-containing protein [Hydrotalea flava]|uniref:DUF58 domain-containing protein n=1 Tax=Hydrotalea TaxID=1004300 RepID=UPI0009444D49|nr:MULTISPECIES: DUF58 domain-containing protein [Hydrotalea]MBY0348538.1 DUF58 domain-containing protein [Hydrotalea flava]GHU51239.1 hypothetical protein FACS1894127_7420 [Clostridia bacterium]NIM36298.1 DUF58 domain-containing protein [Hydrotalea flava]NIM39153.1 DUF58 domain-containing protein [Hydrotalea flava]NIN04392.1 DUF58 domain-containing protein [Hydrotalea flava]
MEASELLKKVRELEIKSKRLTNHLFTGEYHSAFKGRGMVFKEVKEYHAGDDIRFIDWNVSARMNDTFTKVFEEERELEVFILVDASASNLMGTRQQTKKELITEIAAVLAFSALNNNDKAGLLFFTDRVEKYIPSKKGRQHALYMVRELVSLQPGHQQTNIVKALQYLNNITRHKSIVFLLSDFADEGYEEALRIAAKKHDVIGIQVYDLLDVQMPNMGLVVVEDPETGEQLWLDTSNKKIRQQYAAQFAKIQQDAKKVFRTAGADLMQIATGQDYVKTLQQFFIQRA